LSAAGTGAALLEPSDHALQMEFVLTAEHSTARLLGNIGEAYGTFGHGFFFFWFFLIRIKVLFESEIHTWL
jgi:hypothetical protein